MSGIENVMGRLGKILAADRNLKVHVRGKYAYASEGEVTIPAIESFDEISSKTERLLHGLLDHECGHARDTDFSLMEKCKGRPGFFRGIWNALEDGYIESRMSRQYPGTAYNFRIKNRWFWEEGPHDGAPARQIVATPDTLLQGFLMALTMYVREHGGCTLAEVKALSPDVGALLAFVQTEADAVRDLVSETKATAKVFALAEQIWKKLEEEIERQREEQRKEQEGDADESGDEEGKPKPDDDAEVEQTPMPDFSDLGDDDALEREESETDQDTDGKPDDESEDESEGNVAPAPSMPDMTEVDLEDDADEEKQMTPERACQHDIVNEVSDGGYEVFSHEWDLERDFTREDLTKYQRDTEDLNHETREAAEALILAFESSLKALREKRAVPGADEGEIDPTVLSEYALGATPSDVIYKQYLAEDDRDVAVSLLVDCSGSMGAGGRGHGSSGCRFQHARRTAFAMATALHTCQIPVEVTGFTTISDWSSEEHEWVDRTNKSDVEATMREWRAALKPREAHCARPHALPIHATFARFGSDDLRGLQKISAIDQNLDGEAVLWASERLAERPEKRRVLFVLSDGFPAGAGNGDDAGYLLEAVQRVAESGLEIYGLGICSDAVQKFYPRWWVTHNLNDLCELAMSAMSEVLLAGRDDPWMLAV